MDTCFAIDNGQCIVLEVARCNGACKFYKTRERLEADRERANARIANLPIVHQKQISQTFYGGAMPWNEKRRD